MTQAILHELLSTRQGGRLLVAACSLVTIQSLVCCGAIMTSTTSCTLMTKQA